MSVGQPEGPPLDSHEREVRLIEGHARIFLGEIEGARADELNLATNEAFAVANLDETPADKLHDMDHPKTMTWLSAHDLVRGNVTWIIYDAADPNKTNQGHITVTNLPDDQERGARVITKGAARQIHIPQQEKLFALNFDAPWHEGDAYKQIVAGGLTDACKELFQTNPEAVLYMYIPGDEFKEDGLIFRQLGAVGVGKDTYLNHPITRKDRRRDSVFILDRASFVDATAGEEAPIQ